MSAFHVNLPKQRAECLPLSVRALSHGAGENPAPIAPVR